VEPARWLGMMSGPAHFAPMETAMDLSQIPQHAPVIGADGVPIGVVDRIDGHRLKITRKGALTGKKHYVDVGLIADLEGGTVRLSANADVAVLLEDDED
jgi:hypothetical protein